MKLNVVLPWILVLGLSAALGAMYVSSSARNAELTKLKTEIDDVQHLRAELEDAKTTAKTQQDEVAGLRKDNQELLRLRNEVGKLRQESLQLSKQAQTARAEADAAAARAADVSQKMNLQLANIQTEKQLAALNAQRDACINQLRQIDGAKQQWALEHNKTATAVPTPAEIAVYLQETKIPVCPAGGIYTLNSVGQPPTCSIQGHVLPK